MKLFTLLTTIKRTDGKIDKRDAQSKFERDCADLTKIGFELNPDDLNGTNIKEKDNEIKVRCRIFSFPDNTYLVKNDDEGFMILMKKEQKTFHIPLVRFKFDGFKLQIQELYFRD